MVRDTQQEINGPIGGEQWSQHCDTYRNTDTNPLIYPLVDLSRSISTVDSITPTEEHGRHRRSIRLHLRRITVDH